MIIYLYKKTHLITGLQYLGQTSAQDPHRYKGSGKYWKLHLKKHGALYKTEILKECQNMSEIKVWGEYYSKMWDIVKNSNWANLTSESGIGGRHSAEIRALMSKQRKGSIPWNKGLRGIMPASQRQQISKAHKGKIHSGETIAKRIKKLTGLRRTEEQKMRMGASQIGRRHSEESKKKMSDAKIGYTPWNKGIQTGKPSALALTWEITSTDGTMLRIISLKRWCDQMGLCYAVAHRNARNNKPYKGFLITRLVG